MLYKEYQLLQLVQMRILQSSKECYKRGTLMSLSILFKINIYIMEKLKQDLQKYQTNSKTYIKYDTDGYNQYQNYLYKRALHGLNAMTEKEIATMCSKKKQRIINVYKRAQVVINKLKQQATISYSNFLFKSLFPNSPITEFLLTETETDVSIINTLNFKDLNINKSDIITIFMQEGILPKNFLSLEGPQVSMIQLPRLKNE